MKPSKRIMDLFVCVALSFILIPVMICVYLVVLLVDGAPVFYLSERMKTPTEGFKLIKFRTMRPSDVNDGVSGGDKAGRITRTGAVLRRTRVDEIPQLWNVLKGDISFIGPRPPLRQYVERYPVLYQKVLKNRPGISGMASIHFHRYEEYVLGKCSSLEETDDVYCRVCIPRKAKLDLIYQEHQNFCFDVLLMFKTVFRRSR
jgi:lipopolysaccharide/colanic/teichoic acid biosynthesis glycosyltransferase